jgi:glycosyl transferase family 25
LSVIAADEFVVEQMNANNNEYLINNQRYAIDKIYLRYTKIPIHISPIQKNNSIGLFMYSNPKNISMIGQTINSFFHSILDLNIVSDFFVISDHVPQKIQENYPFLKFISSNIFDYLDSYSYILVLESGWVIYNKDHYISKMIEVLESGETYGQCLINQNYVQNPSEIDFTENKINRTSSGLKYYINNEEKCHNFILQPSLVKTSVLKKVGLMNTTIDNSELDYARRYTEQGFKTCFLVGLHCKNMGNIRVIEKTEEILSNTDLRIKNFVINLDRRPDMYEKFKNNSKNIPLEFERFSAIDGQKLKITRQMLQIFDNNDYRYRRGIVGCALSHIKLFTELLRDNDHDCYLITEDDAEFSEDFYERYKTIIKTSKDWDIIFLGHLYRAEHSSFYDNRNRKTFLQQMKSQESLLKSMGGTQGYLINKKGCQNMLDFIGRTGMTNAIDTMQQKAGDILNVYYCVPRIIYTDSNPVTNPSDIQNNFQTLYMSPNDRIEEEIRILKSRNIKYMILDYSYGNGWWIDRKYVSISADDIEKVYDMFYKDRIKKYNKITDSFEYNIEDCLIY